MPALHTGIKPAVEGTEPTTQQLALIGSAGSEATDITIDMPKGLPEPLKGPQRRIYCTDGPLCSWRSSWGS